MLNRSPAREAPAAAAASPGAPLAAGAGCSLCFRISQRAIGPPSKPPPIRPKVAKAMPIALAPARPACSASAPQAIEVPWPPAKEMLPPISP